ncbi:MAG: tRNA (adenosine(37)-N6)-threonylcarbamoyltransferase complex ATPase subunit type 1 TsaE [Oscillospiraceae bacterium]|nr:tRNA (adenosine(37)-N6)-threonylcarbamoyltransferase complex ATPase subunit type 1 TsaE [Oscillospiraceae bacterium]
MLHTTHTPIETEQLAADFAATLQGGEVIALFGDLGAGKTAFVRGLARGLGINAPVSSPTYAIVQEYRKDARAGAGIVSTLIHFDMYRVTTWADLESCGFFDYLNSGAVLAIEWSENIAEVLPKNAVRVKIECGTAEDERVVTLPSP